MYYRRKCILALIERFNGALDKMAVQKLLFLLAQNSANRQFDFVPYKYGCYSFQANYDLSVMSKLGQVSETEKSWRVPESSHYLSEIASADKQAIGRLFKQFAPLDIDELIRFTYINYPRYATRSLLAKKLLSSSEFAAVKELQKQDGEKTFFTIGYEGKSIDAYMHRLVCSNVKTLFDVRKNALSMKYGFSKSTLKKCCEGLGIDYVHLPELGIASDRRQQLNTQSDYDAVFTAYEKEVLPATGESQQLILNTLEKTGRVAITCFEKDLSRCHRTRLTKALQNTCRGELKVEHL
ncbi:MAG TPA: DUF488 domain-containing protein [Candidatus Riflebacteria bacterium]|jgi:uncharacterized protein (DUF488 family)|nr:DUF488 domain-containing protein [Candidatus Riflebacteria bacterium]